MLLSVSSICPSRTSAGQQYDQQQLALTQPQRHQQGVGGNATPGSIPGGDRLHPHRAGAAALPAGRCSRSPSSTSALNLESSLIWTRPALCPCAGLPTGLPLFPHSRPGQPRCSQQAPPQPQGLAVGAGHALSERPAKQPCGGPGGSVQRGKRSPTLRPARCRCRCI